MGLFSKKNSKKDGFDKLLEISSNSNVFPVSQSETHSTWTVKETLLSDGESFIKADLTAIDSDDDFIHIRTVTIKDVKIRRNTVRLNEQKESVLSLIPDSHKKEIRPYLEDIFEKKPLPPFKIPTVDKDLTMLNSAIPEWTQKNKTDRPWAIPKNVEPKTFFYSNICQSCGETYQEWMSERSLCIKCRMKM